MNKKSVYSIISYINLFVMISFQFTSPLFSFFDNNIKNCTFYNVFLMYCVAKAAFGESSILFLLLFGIITSAFIVALIKLLKKKGIYFIIPFTVVIIDCICHSIFYVNVGIAWFGFIYKAISAIIFLIPTLITIRDKKKTTL